jgi:hypothetical protein
MRRELRSDLTAAAGDVGMSDAVRDLGSAAVLAQELKLAEGRKLWHPWTGAITSVILAYAWAGMMIATVNALTAAAIQLGTGRTVTVHATWLGSTVSVTHGERLSGGVEFSVVPVLVIVIISLIAARTWRSPRPGCSNDWPPVGLTIDEVAGEWSTGHSRTFAPLRWSGWQDEVAALRSDEGLSVYPPPFTREGQDIAAASRRAVPVRELFDFYDDSACQLVTRAN